MKELSMQEKAKRYDEVVAMAKECVTYVPDEAVNKYMLNMFPELKETEDERIRKWLIAQLEIKSDVNNSRELELMILKSIAWLEKQDEKKESSLQTNERAWLYLVSDVLTWKDGIGQYLDNPEVQKLAKKLCKEYKQRLYNPVQDVSLEQNPIQRKDFISIPFGTDSELISEIVVIPDGCVATIEDNKIHIKREEKTDSTDNIEPKFKVGDWITFYGCKPFKILKVELEQNGILNYLLLDQNGHDSYYNKRYVDENARLWTIKDAKDGDVLYSPFHNLIWIYKDSEHYHVCVNLNYTTQNIAINGLIGIPKDVFPATKDEQTILFERIKEDGCEWNAEKKELNKVIIYESKIRE